MPTTHLQCELGSGNTIDRTGATYEDAILLNKPSRHSHCLFVIHLDCIIHQLPASFEISGHSVDPNTLNNGINLMSPSCSFPFFVIVHDTILHPVEKSPTWRICQHNFQL